MKQRFKNGIEKKLKRLPDWMDWFKYLINLKSIDIDQEVLRLIKERENVSLKKAILWYQAEKVKGSSGCLIFLAIERGIERP